MPTQIELARELSADSNNWYKKYPWFSLGQLINVSNNKQHDSFQPAAQFTAIYFNDVQRLHWLLNEQVFNKNKILNDLSVPVGIENMQSTPQPFPKREHPQEITAPTHLIAIAAVEEADALAAKSTIPKENILAEDVIIHSHIKYLADDKLVEGKADVKANEINDNKLFEQPEIYVQLPEETKKIEEIKVTEKITEKKEQTKERLHSVIPEEETQDNKDEIVDNKSIATADRLESITKAQENIKGVLDNADALSISFEPYHTIDYFASQGIKVDTKTDDRLGKQLKSFTSWLKSMKRLPVTEENVTEANVQLQDKSLENTNVVTEAMAAVLLKQEKKEQAIEIFKKLSLLHPEKSRYFAAQIEQIKN